MAEGHDRSPGRLQNFDEDTSMDARTFGPAFAALLFGTGGAIDRPLPNDGATPVVAVVEYEIPRPGNFPHDPAVGPDGIVWYTDQTNSFIGRLDPSTGAITDFPTPTPMSGPHG